MPATPWQEWGSGLLDPINKARMDQPPMSDLGQSRHPYSMTEEDWQTSRDPSLMLMFLPHAGLDRKFRLFACACARRVWHLCNDELPHQVLELGENFADGIGSRDELL